MVITFSTLPAIGLYEQISCMWVTCVSNLFSISAWHMLKSCWWHYPNPAVVVPSCSWNKPVRAMWMLLSTSFLSMELEQSAGDTKGQLSGPTLVCSIAWWQILMCGPVSAGMGRLPYSAGPAVPSMQLLSSIDVVLSWNRYLHVDLFAHCRTEEGLGSGNCPVSYSSGYCLHCGGSWRSAFDKILLCFESRLFLSHQVNPNPDLGQWHCISHPTLETCCSGSSLAVSAPCVCPFCRNKPVLCYLL